VHLAAAETGQWHDLGVGAACAAGWFAIFYALFLIGPRLLGFGDVRLAVVLGLALGWLGVWYVLLGFFAANLIGALLGLVLITTGHMSRRDRIPYGVFLALGCAVAVFAGPELLAPLMHTSL
jgi:leader peptidase (prepilin peptidase)/N-methyltransferase